MSKMPLQAQSCWEYLYFTRKSEQALWGEMNVAGSEGWELVTTHIYKDPKGVMTWIAFLKRRAGSVAAGPPKAAGAATPAGEKPPAAEKEKIDGFDLSGEVFEFKKD